MITRRAAISAGLAAGLTSAGRVSQGRSSLATIRIGNTMPYTGPASYYSIIGEAARAFFRMVNDQGGVDGHRIEFISLDDGYNPARTVEDARRLLEEMHVDFFFSTLGTASNSAIVDYLNHNGVPQLFVVSGASKWADYKKYPWTMGWLPDYRTEAQIYAKFALKMVNDPRFAILYQNDDFGKDYPAGVRDVVGKDWTKYVVGTASYEVTDATVDSQIVELQSSGANVLIVAAISKFAAQAIRKVHDIAWKPSFFLAYSGSSVGGVMNPAGPENGIGIISAGYQKDWTDPAWSDDPGVNTWRAFMRQCMPGANLLNGGYISAYGMCLTMLQVLKQCRGDFSRANVMHQAENLHDLEIPVLLPGIRINTSRTGHEPITAMQLTRWTGKTWQFFGSLIEGDNV